MRPLISPSAIRLTALRADLMKSDAHGRRPALSETRSGNRSPYRWMSLRGLLLRKSSRAPVPAAFVPDVGDGDAGASRAFGRSGPGGPSAVACLPASARENRVFRDGTPSRSPSRLSLVEVSLDRGAKKGLKDGSSRLQGLTPHAQTAAEWRER
jgi:hypothetical protein